MTHFMEWLYIHYIRPEIQQSDDSEYKEYFSLLTDGLTVRGRTHLRPALLGPQL